MLTALRGALGFLSRLPVGRSESAWEAFRTTPTIFPVAGYLLGALLAVPVAGAVALGLPAPTVAFCLVLAVALLTGIAHADGVADLGDAAVVHGDAERRRSVLQDTTVGVGAVLALGVVLAGLALAGLALAGLPPLTVAGLIVASEVGAKLAMATLACLGEPSHEGMGAAVVRETGARRLPFVVALAAPAAVLTWPSLAGLGALVGSIVMALALWWWTAQRLGGVPGDALGAANDLARVVALHAGVIAWTLS